MIENFQPKITETTGQVRVEIPDKISEASKNQGREEKNDNFQKANEEEQQNVEEKLRDIVSAIGKTDIKNSELSIDAKPEERGNHNFISGIEKIISFFLKLFRRKKPEDKEAKEEKDKSDLQVNLITQKTPENYQEMLHNEVEAGKQFLASVINKFPDVPFSDKTKVKYSFAVAYINNCQDYLRYVRSRPEMELLSDGKTATEKGHELISEIVRVRKLLKGANSDFSIEPESALKTTEEQFTEHFESLEGRLRGFGGKFEGKELLWKIRLTIDHLESGKNKNYPNWSNSRIEKMISALKEQYAEKEKQLPDEQNSFDNFVQLCKSGKYKEEIKGHRFEEDINKMIQFAENKNEEFFYIRAKEAYETGTSKPHGELLFDLRIKTGSPESTATNGALQYMQSKGVFAKDIKQMIERAGGQLDDRFNPNLHIAKDGTGLRVETDMVKFVDEKTRSISRIAYHIENDSAEPITSQFNQEIRPLSLLIYQKFPHEFQWISRLPISKASSESFEPLFREAQLINGVKIEDRSTPDHSKIGLRNGSGEDLGTISVEEFGWEEKLVTLVKSATKN
jgi:hypothetical protein